MERPSLFKNAVLSEAALPPFEPNIPSRWLRRYARLASSATTGAVFLD
jgi:hypothetical protein